MGQILHGSARTTEAVRRAIQLRQESVRAAARRYGVSPTTIQKWRARQTTADAAMGPKEPRSTVLTPEEEAVIVAFRRQTLLPLDDCLYGLQPTIPHLTRSSLRRCLERHSISRLPEMAGDKPKKKRFADYLIGYVDIDIAEVRTEEAKLYLLWLSTEPRSWLSPSWRRRPTATPLQTSSARWSRSCRTRSTRC
jgi:transposase